MFVAGSKWIKMYEMHPGETPLRSATAQLLCSLTRHHSRAPDAAGEGAIGILPQPFCIRFATVGSASPGSGSTLALSTGWTLSLSHGQSKQT